MARTYIVQVRGTIETRRNTQNESVEIKRSSTESTSLLSFTWFSISISQLTLKRFAAEKRAIVHASTRY